MSNEKTLRANEVPRLVIQLPDGKEVHHSIAGSEITIGRDPSNRICLPDDFVSKFHAKLFVSGSSLTLVDLESANKTYVNGLPIQKGACLVDSRSCLRVARVGRLRERQEHLPFDDRFLVAKVLKGPRVRC